MFTDLAQVAVSLAMLYVGGEWLVRGASELASRLGVSSLAIGLTVVAFGTSTPELAVSVNAALEGANDISLANVVGSNIANVALILGLGAMIRPIRANARLIRIDAPIMVVVSVVLLAMLYRGGIGRMEASLLVFGLVAYTALTFRTAKAEPMPVREELASAVPRRLQRAAAAGALVLTGLAVLVFGGRLLVDAAVGLASDLGVSQLAIGLTIVAIGTSLPELSTTVVASLKGQGDIAIGNVVGSNIVNILGILGLTSLLHPLGIGGLRWVDLGIMLGLACLVMVIVFARRQLDRLAGALLLSLFALYTGWLLVA